MTKKMNVHPEWKILQTLTNGAKRKLDHLLLHLVNGLLWKTNDESGTPRSQSGWKTSWAKKDDKEDQCASRVVDSSNTNQWVVDGDLRFILKVGSSFCNQCAVDVARSSLDFSNTNQWGKKKAGSSPSSSGKWAAVEFF
ncbi:hypothetical protein Tco_1472374 [Tanacetum coccineum]